MLSEILDSILFSFCVYSLYDCLFNISGKRALGTYEVGNTLLTNKKYNFSKKIPTSIKELVFTKKFDNICTITLDRIEEDIECDTTLYQYKRIPIIGKIKNNEQNFIYFVVFTEDFKNYVKKHNIKFNLTIDSYNRVVSHDSSGPNFKYEFNFSIDKKYYTRMKLVDLIS